MQLASGSSAEHVLTILVPQHCIAAPHNAGVDRGHHKGGPPHSYGTHAVNAKAVMPVRPSPAGAQFQLQISIHRIEQHGQVDANRPMQLTCGRISRTCII